MFIELRHSGDLARKCPECGAAPLLYQGDLPLRADILDLPEVSRFRPLARRRRRLYEEYVNTLILAILERTCYPIHSSSDAEPFAVDRS